MLTTRSLVGDIYNTDEESLLAQGSALDERSFVELVVWRLNEPVVGCTHSLKYRLAYVVDGAWVVRYDNEAGKGDHRHVGSREQAYRFRSLDVLQVDCWADVAARERKEMKVVTIGVASLAGVKARLSQAMRGKSERAGARIDFASAELLWRVLAPNRLAILRAMAGAGPLALREIARRVGRDVKGVHTDVHALLLAGVLDRLEEGFVFPFDAVHVDFTLQAAA